MRRQSPVVANPVAVSHHQQPPRLWAFRLFWRHHHMTGQPGKVRKRRDLALWEGSTQQVLNCNLLVRIDFQPYTAAWGKHAWEIGHQQANQMESVVATVKCQAGFGREIRIAVDLMRGEIGEIRQHHRHRFLDW